MSTSSTQSVSNNDAPLFSTAQESTAFDDCLQTLGLQEWRGADLTPAAKERIVRLFGGARPAVTVERERFVDRAVTIRPTCGANELREAAAEIAKFDREFAVHLLAAGAVTGHFPPDQRLDCINACARTKFADTPIDAQAWEAMVIEATAIRRYAGLPVARTEGLDKTLEEIGGKLKLEARDRLPKRCLDVALETLAELGRNVAGNRQAIQAILATAQALNQPESAAIVQEAQKLLDQFERPERSDTGATLPTTNLTSTTTASTTATVPAMTTITSRATATTTTATTTTTTNSTTSSVTVTTGRDKPLEAPAIQSVPRTLPDCLKAAGILPDKAPGIARRKGAKAIFIRHFGGTRPLVARTGDGKTTDMFTVSKSCTADQLCELASLMDECGHYYDATQLLVSAALSLRSAAADRVACLANAVSWGPSQLNERNTLELAAQWRLLMQAGIRLADRDDEENVTHALERKVRMGNAERQVLEIMNARAQKLREQRALPDRVEKARESKPLTTRRSMRFSPSGPSQKTEIEAAFASGDWKSVRRLMRDFDSLPTRTVGESGTTVLGLACKHGALDIAREWLASHLASVGTGLLDHRSQASESPLWLACRFGHDEVVQFMLDQGAAFASADASFAVKAAVEFGHLEVTKRLVDRKPELLGEVLRAAVDTGQLTILKWHWKTCKPTTREKLSSSIVNRAAKCRSLKPMRWLIKQGVRLEETWENKTPLHTACAAGRVATVKLLHANKAQMTGDDLWVACQNRHVEVVEWLLRHGAAPEHPKLTDEQLLAWKHGSRAQSAIASLILQFTQRELRTEDLLDPSAEDSE